MAYIEDLKMEARKKAQSILLSLQKKHKNNLAAMYADAEATAASLELTAETPTQIKKSLAYNFARDNLGDLIIYTYMKNAGYTYGGEDLNINYSWRKEGVENGNDSNN